MPTATLLNTKTLMARSGATFRQIDHWARLGYLACPSAREGTWVGSGVSREYPESEVLVARLLVALGNHDMLCSSGRGRKTDYLPDLIAHVREIGLTGLYAIGDGFVTLDLSRCGCGG